MSKVVTIPTYQSPFVVMVNGVKYVFPAGSVQEVPDEVAVVIEANGRKKPEEPVDAPFDCCEGGGTGGSVQSDWNQNDSSAADFIKNKPFGDIPTGGDTLYWDGNTEGLANIEGVFFRVSDAVPTKEDFLNGCSVAMTYGSQMIQITITSEEVQSGFSEDGLYFGEIFQIVPHDNYTDEFGTIEKKGVYLVREESGAYLCSLTIPGYTGFPVTKKIEEKYLPGAVILYTDETYLYKTADTSDTSKRMTKEELRQLQQSGLAAYIDDTADTYWPIVGYYFGEGYGEADIVINMPGSPVMFAFYTAEYVPEE